MDNSGNGRLRVPGYGGIPIDFQLPPRERFAHGFEDFRQTPAITAREMAMVEAMNLITDEPGWHERVFDDGAAQKWAEETEIRNKLVGKRAWRWCLAELRDKAVEYREQRFVRVLDMGSCACKSDEIVQESVSIDLKTTMDRIFAKQSRRKAAFCAIDPDMYALDYGKTHVLDSGGFVKLLDFAWGELKQSKIVKKGNNVRHRGFPDFGLCSKEMLEELRCNPRLHSQSYQRLPCDVDFVGAGTDVQITSYINNAHPSQLSLYKSIEKLVSCSIPLWNSCLIRGTNSRPNDNNNGHVNRAGDQIQQGRVPLRIICFGALWENDLQWSSGYASLDFARMVEAYDRAKQETLANRPKKIKLFGESLHVREVLRRLNWAANLPPIDPYQETSDTGDLARLRWKHPQPDKAFSYAQWKSGKNIDRAVVDMIARPSPTRRAKKKPAHTKYKIKLQDRFRVEGLQVVVQVRGINLSDQVSRDWYDSWRLEGSLNDHVVASTIYAYDVKDVDAEIRFRQETPMEASVYRYEKGEGPAWCRNDDLSKIRWREGCREDEVGALLEVFGLEDSRNIKYDIGPNYGSPQFQQTGEVALPQGRLLSFSNAVEHRLGMKLAPDKATGHFRYVAIHLVDPNYRICSTMNVPPQQHHWQEHAVTEVLKQGGLPQELIDIILDSSRSSMSISEEEARERRKRILLERDCLASARRTRVGTYNF
jgi:hypothetical protein